MDRVEARRRFYLWAQENLRAHGPLFVVGSAARDAFDFGYDLAVEDGKSISQPAREYIVKAPVGLVTFASTGERPTYFNGEKWVPCRHCAKRYTRDEAHAVAHKDPSRVVIKLVPKKEKKP